jgi:hypothetical protein
MTQRFGILARGLALTVTVGVSFGLAGCGNDAATTSVSADNRSVVEESGSSAVLTRDDLISTAYEAAMDAGSAHMSMTMKGDASMSAEGDMTYAAGSSAMRMTMSMPQMGKGEMELRLVEKKMYLKVPGMTPPGKFIAIDPQDESSPMSKGFAGLADQMDPLASVKAMESAVTSVNRVGAEKVDGVSTDHYRVVVDTARLIKDLDKPEPAGMPKTVSYDMWLDGDNLIRKMTFDVRGASVEMLLSGWGKPVEVERPSPGDIVERPGA